MDFSVAPPTRPTSSRDACEASLKEVRITASLASRPSREPDHAAENAALRALLRASARDPASVPGALARLALELCGAGTAGLSLVERDERGREVVRWVALAGQLAEHVGGTTPRDWSPCGACLDEGSPQLYERPARHFTYLEPADIAEGLVVPFIGTKAPLGTIWVVAHGGDRRFDREDVRVLECLAEVAVSVYERAHAHEVAEQAQHTRDRLLSIVSHDLRNLLSVVLMNSAMLGRQAASLGADDVLRWAEKTRRASEQMSRLLNDLLDSAALEAGRLRLAPAPLDPTQLLRDSVGSLEPLAASRRVDLRIAPGSISGYALSADRTRLRQAIDGLVAQALEVTPAGARVTLDVVAEGADVVFSVSDEGPRVEGSEVLRPLQRFTTGERRGGHALGLWMAKLIVEAHGGRLWSAPGAERGSIHRMAIPAR